MQTGTLKIELSVGGALPVSDAVVRVRTLDGRLLYDQTITLGSDGESRVFQIETPDIELSLDKNEIPAPYSLCNVEVLSGNFKRVFINGVQIFAQRQAILQIPLIPDTASFPSSAPPETLIIPPNGLRLPPQPEGDTSSLLPQSPTGQLHAFPFIPEYITVHLGLPTDFSAKNVTVTFQDYIKNVASSEIYPTWPEEALKANIIAQISFVLNRVYTEWYRSRGYTFDITNATAFDQYFVEGRNIFQNISEIVDEIFNIYMTKPSREEPFFARYCNGTTSTCDGLSQWGTVSLANDGLSFREILEFYYGEIELTETNDIRGPFDSYPGNPLTVGSSGAPVRQMQEHLNRIAINYPSIGFIEVDGFYGEKTAESVRAFQRIFNLDIDGIVGKATWYAISRIYVAVKRLAELTSEGERADYASQEYPGTPLRLGDRSVEVLEIQLYLSTIALYNNSVKTVSIDGVYGESTLNSVVSFQRAYGIDPDGIVGEITWNRLVDVYNGIKENVDVPLLGSDTDTAELPDADFTVGAIHEFVPSIATAVNILSENFDEIASVEVSNEYSKTLSESIKGFQSLMSLPITGNVDKLTWNYLTHTIEKMPKAKQKAKTTSTPQAEANTMEIMENAEANTTDISESLTQTPEDTQETANASEENITQRPQINEIEIKETKDDIKPEKHTTARTKKLNRTEPFERPLRVGNIGTDVAKMKCALCEKGYLDTNAQNGDIFGIATRRAVEALQRDYSLPVTGRVDEETWKAIFD